MRSGTTRTVEGTTVPTNTRQQRIFRTSGQTRAKDPKSGTMADSKVKERSLRRRGKKKSRKSTVVLKLIQTNMDGYTSKKESLCEIVNSENPDVITINDTALKGNLKVKIPEYFCFAKNREKNKGGVATVVAEYLKPNPTKVVDGREGDEYIVTRFDITVPAFNLVHRREESIEMK